MSIVVNAILAVVWVIIASMCWRAGLTPSSVFWLLILAYLISPIKHPCDYNGYKAWWADRKNWLK